MSERTHTDPRWRAKAREVLYNYTTNMLLLRRQEQDVIYSSMQRRDQRYRRGGVSNPTMLKALALDDNGRRQLQRQVAVVDKLIHSLRQDGRRHKYRCLQLLQLVYFSNKRSLFYASLDLEISERTAKRMNSELLSFVACEMGWLASADAPSSADKPQPECP